jgi:hypothetical protein
MALVKLPILLFDRFLRVEYGSRSMSRRAGLALRESAINAQTRMKNPNLLRTGVILTERPMTCTIRALGVEYANHPRCHAL